MERRRDTGDGCCVHDDTNLFFPLRSQSPSITPLSHGTYTSPCRDEDNSCRFTRLIKLQTCPSKPLSPSMAMIVSHVFPAFVRCAAGLRGPWRGSRQKLNSSTGSTAPIWCDIAAESTPSTPSALSECHLLRGLAADTNISVMV